MHKRTSTSVTIPLLVLFSGTIFSIQHSQKCFACALEIKIRDTSNNDKTVTQLTSSLLALITAFHKKPAVLMIVIRTKYGSLTRGYRLADTSCFTNCHTAYLLLPLLSIYYSYHVLLNKWGASSTHLWSWSSSYQDTRGLQVWPTCHRLGRSTISYEGPPRF